VKQFLPFAAAVLFLCLLGAAASSPAWLLPWLDSLKPAHEFQVDAIAGWCNTYPELRFDAFTMAVDDEITRGEFDVFEKKAQSLARKRDIQVLKERLNYPTIPPPIKLEE
jgi:hypothetical protein